ncbi:MAG: hypothetical protein A3J65_04275 [Candidatus Buchananbacteria bacterium RIFCSPHIGHO2_02_FULL_45_11b]|uniref:Uncharacterized protein n=4 Tax=Candidatus Buchananiibacteriota TaxID=1817903 RepID=A0A1G1YN02_9BACT|nr:MAG: hypothetical protein A2663_00905 [Candidatus Buchananbacteria bacterium RIFCSPHIGHO2_01_FULL_46_12]OGY50081.1 MAG: hypothetical protein A3J65_04275 [Candidatus Buchananbacteria bacterium RIFCSPHIGHO2_02_FULL_45_11b]OGY53671.1 MAG: hypothetical protein A3B15_01950 [Candidatus Buchananbacteria bacterium RIFCSPLOWO2_01_FULL_45_31]OGY56224.1 MAG: hypothetical protein A3H67_03915 [Candidatus Buchananbacteria bacterium RIFCSPLOWO2_02_FULL_46_11b]
MDTFMFFREKPEKDKGMMHSGEYNDAKAAEKGFEKATGFPRRGDVITCWMRVSTCVVADPDE